jgi:hypothetical protein
MKACEIMGRTLPAPRGEVESKRFLVTIFEVVCYGMGHSKAKWR